MKDVTGYSLLRHNTFGINAACRRFVEFSTVEEAQRVALSLKAAQQPFMVIGGGSNLLLTRDYDGTVVHSALRGVSLTVRGDEALLCCGSGETWDDVVAWSVAQGYASLVNLSLIPGEVGASAVQNIGAYGAEAGQFVSRVLAVETGTGRRVAIDGADCHYAYRSSRFKHEWAGRYLITHVVYRLSRRHPLLTDYGNISTELERRGLARPTAADLRQVIIDIRRDKLPDPAELGNAGSFFMNPVVERGLYEALAARHPQMPHYPVDDGHVKIPAAWLIDQCGWKGRSLGRAGVHSRQALVLVNRGGATGAEVVALCRAIQADVAQRFGIEIKPEVNIV